MEMKMDLGMEQDPAVSSSELDDVYYGNQSWKLLEENEVELKNWLQRILSDYCNQTLVTAKKVSTEKKFLSSPPKPFYRRVLDKAVDCFAFLGGGKPETKNVEAGFLLLEIKSGVVVPSFDYGKAEAGSVQVNIKYQLGVDGWTNTDDIKIHAVKFVHALTPTGSEADYLDSMKREVGCYTKIFPLIESTGFATPFPICYFGKYQTQELSTHLFLRDDQTQTTDAILVFQDLEKCKFQQTKTTLTVSEGKAVLKAIAKIHAATWTLQENSGRSLLDEFPFLIGSQAATGFYNDLSRRGLTRLISLMPEFVKDEPDGDTVMEKIVYWKENLYQILHDLLGPSTGPSTLLHMDLRPDNIHFHLLEEDDEVEEEEETDELEVKVSGWKLASYGSSIHDVAFLLLSSFKTQDRRFHAHELILSYYEAFIEVVRRNELVTPFGLNELYDEYDRSLFLSLLIISGNLGSEDNLDACGLGIFLDAIRDVIRAGIF